MNTKNKRPLIKSCSLAVRIHSTLFLWNFAQDERITPIMVSEAKRSRIHMIGNLQKKSIFIFLSLLTFYSCTQQTVYIIPFLGFEKNNALFEQNERDNITKPYRDLRNALQKLGYHVEVSIFSEKPENVAFILSFNMPKHKITWQYLPQFSDKSFLFLFEPPIVSLFDYEPYYHQYFSRVFTMFDEDIDHKKYHKLYYPQPSLQMIDAVTSFHQKKLLTLISCQKTSQHEQELYSKRLEAINFFEYFYPQNFEFFGVGWSPLQHRCYKGTVKSKFECLKNYKFCVCFENMHSQKGYITEKIFDCFVAGCIPIYWGADNITDYIPKNCFIDYRNFSSWQELYNFLNGMSEENYLYYQKNIQQFLASDSAFLFSIENFIDTILTTMCPGYNKELVFSAYTIKKLTKVKKDH